MQVSQTAVILELFRMFRPYWFYVISANTATSSLQFQLNSVGVYEHANYPLGFPNPNFLSYNTKLYDRYNWYKVVDYFM